MDRPQSRPEVELVLVFVILLLEASPRIGELLGVFRIAGGEYVGDFCFVFPILTRSPIWYTLEILVQSIPLQCRDYMVAG
jgi:hypothetical protein